MKIFAKLLYFVSKEHKTGDLCPNIGGGLMKLQLDATVVDGTLRLGTLPVGTRFLQCYLHPQDTSGNPPYPTQ